MFFAIGQSDCFSFISDPELKTTLISEIDEKKLYEIGFPDKSKRPLEWKRQKVCDFQG